MFDFLTELAKNNNKEWFDAHKAQYESATRIISYASFFDFMTEALTTNLNGEQQSYR